MHNHGAAMTYCTTAGVTAVIGFLAQSQPALSAIASIIAIVAGVIGIMKFLFGGKPQ